MSKTLPAFTHHLFRLIGFWPVYGFMPFDWSSWPLSSQHYSYQFNTTSVLSRAGVFTSQGQGSLRLSDWTPTNRASQKVVQWPGLLLGRLVEVKNSHPNLVSSKCDEMGQFWISVAYMYLKWVATCDCSSLNESILKNCCLSNKICLDFECNIVFRNGFRACFSKRTDKPVLPQRSEK